MITSIPPLMTAVLVMNVALVILATKSERAYKLLPLCIATIFWHGIWSFLFQIEDEALAYQLAKAGHIFILYLPVAVLIAFHEYFPIPKAQILALGHAVYAVLLGLLLGSDLVISGVQRLPFGFYPVAGPLHPLVLCFISACLLYSFIASSRVRAASTDPVLRKHIRILNRAMVIFSLASFDFLLNYRLITFYPIGFLFSCVFVSLVFFAMFRLAAFRREEQISILEARILSREKMAAIGTLTAGIAHQLGNTINSMKMSVMALEAIGPTENEDFFAVMQAMQRSISASEKILKGINFGVKSNTELGRKNVCDMIDTAVILIKGKLLERTRVCIDVDPGVFVEAVETSFLNAISNLLSNAADAGASEVHISLEGDSLVVRDNGPGVPAAIRGKIFDLLFTTKSEDQGSGIGLAVVSSELARMGWTIHLRSSEQGAVFVISGIKVLLDTELSVAA